MQEISGYKIEINHLNPIQFEVTITTPESDKFWTRKQIFPKPNEEQCFQMFRQDGALKNWVIDV